MEKNPRQNSRDRVLSELSACTRPRAGRFVYTEPFDSHTRTAENAIPISQTSPAEAVRVQLPTPEDAVRSSASLGRRERPDPSSWDRPGHSDALSSFRAISVPQDTDLVETREGLCQKKCFCFT